MLTRFSGPGRSSSWPKRPNACQQQRRNHYQGDPKTIRGPRCQRTRLTAVCRRRRNCGPTRDPQPASAQADGDRPGSMAAGKQCPAGPGAFDTTFCRSSGPGDAAAEARAVRRPTTTVTLRPGDAREQQSQPIAAKGVAELRMGEAKQWIDDWYCVGTRRSVISIFPVFIPPV